MGSTTFFSNNALTGGAIYNDNANLEDGEIASTTIFPDDTVFLDNEAEVRGFCAVVHEVSFLAYDSAVRYSFPPRDPF